MPRYRRRAGSSSWLLLVRCRIGGPGIAVAAAWWRGGAGAQGEPAAHVQPGLALGGDVRPEQRGKAAQVVRGQLGHAPGENGLGHREAEVFSKLKARAAACSPTPRLQPLTPR